MSDFDIPTFDSNTAFGDVNGISQQGTGDTIVTVTPMSPTPDAFQISEAIPAQTLRMSLQDDAITNLSNGTSPFGPTDIDFAFQWNLDIPPDGSVTISKTMVTVPEPGSILLIGVGVWGLLSTCRRSKE